MIAYRIGDKAYINLTNRCSNDCTFCVRRTSEEYEQFSLWLDREPEYDDIIAALQPFMELKEFVFCGYGEPLYRIDMIVRVGEYLKGKGKYVRVNTNGQGDLIVGKDAAKRLAGKVDEVSVSLNEVSAAAYQKLCRCEFGEEGYYSMLRFASDCVKAGIKVKLSIVDILGAEKTEKAKQIAAEIGAELRIRALIK